MMELLSPAGSWESMVAAVQSGADAVYLGVGTFNARRSAKNFSREDLPRAVAYCHLRGVKVYLTLNTLLTDRELEEAGTVLREASQWGVDAVLIQDWGLFALARETVPDLPIHASTQMSLMTLGGAQTAAALGMERVVLARELTDREIGQITRNCPAEVEVFGHGALCMCYSGQCAMSALIGQRSGNRGRCAQPCRMIYGVDAPAANGRPLSLKDANLADQLGRMRELGIACVKLEGRMKRPEYVAVITGIYRRLLDQQRLPTSQEQRQLYDAFSRSGFTAGYFLGKKGPEMFGSRPENTPEPRELFAAARASYEKEDRRTTPVDMALQFRSGLPAVLTAQVGDVQVQVQGPVPEIARNRALSREDLAQRLGKTGGTAFSLGKLTLDWEDGLMLPASALNALRRDALEALSQALTTPRPRRNLPSAPLPEASKDASGPLAFTCSITRPEQLTDALLNCHPEWVYVPLELLDRMDPELWAGRTKVCAVLPRVFRTDDEAPLRRLLQEAKGISGVAVSNLGHLPLVQGLGLEIRGDFGLNVFNSRSLRFLQQQGLHSATVSFELRQAQIRDLRKHLPCEAIVYGRLPLMITENCPVRRCNDCGGTKLHYLQDRTGAQFPVLPLPGCRSEIQNSQVLFLADKPDFRQAGLTWGRLRFTDEDPETCVAVFRRYLGQGGHQPESFTRGLFYRGVE